MYKLLIAGLLASSSIVVADYNSSSNNMNSNNSSSYGTNSTSDFGPNDSYQTQSDRDILKKVRSKVRDTFSSRFDNLMFAVNNGVVTISGNVKTQDDLNDLNKKIKDISKIDGVKSVNNNAQVGLSANAVNGDTTTTTGYTGNTNAGYTGTGNYGTSSGMTGTGNSGTNSSSTTGSSSSSY